MMPNTIRFFLCLIIAIVFFAWGRSCSTCNDYQDQNTIDTTVWREYIKSPPETVPIIKDSIVNHYHFKKKDSLIYIMGEIVSPCPPESVSIEYQAELPCTSFVYVNPPQIKTPLLSLYSQGSFNSIVLGASVRAGSYNIGVGYDFINQFPAIYISRPLVFSKK
jgi:hypothetical protein